MNEGLGIPIVGVAITNKVSKRLDLSMPRGSSSKIFRF